MNQDNEDVPYGYCNHQDNRVDFLAETPYQSRRTKIYEKIGTLCDDPAGLTCSHDTLKRSGLARMIVPFPSFEAAARSTIYGEIDGLWVPAAYPDVRKFFVNQELTLVREEIPVLTIPNLVLVGKMSTPPSSVKKIYYHPATSNFLNKIKIPYGQQCLLERVTSNSMAAKAVIQDDESSAAITNNLCAEHYGLHVYQIFRDDIAFPFFLFIKSHFN